MDIEIISTNTDNYLLIKSTGTLINEQDLIIHAKKLYEEIIKYKNNKILLDNTDIQFPSNLFQFYNLVQSYNTDFPPDIRFLKIACLLSADYIKQGKFWETVCANQGFEYLAFTSLEEAVQWLK